jgi:hypothetical protein
MCDRGSGSLYSNPGDNPHRRLAVRRGFPVLCPALGFAQQPRRKCEPAMNSPRPERSALVSGCGRPWAVLGLTRTEFRVKGGGLHG